MAEGGRLEILREPVYRRVFAAQAISLLGDGMVGVALAFAVLGLTGSPADLGVVLAARTIPLVVLLLIGGTVADRMARRTVMVIADLTRFGSQGLMAALLLVGEPEIWMLAVLAAVGGGASAFFVPASTGLIPAIVPPDRLQHANALRGLAVATGTIAGPVLAGLLVAGVGAGWALAADAATFAVSATLLVGVPAGRSTVTGGTTLLEDLRGGWVAFRHYTWIWTTVLMAALSNLIYASFTVLGPLVALRHLGGARSWSLIVAAGGAGSVLGGLCALHITPRRPARLGALVLVVTGVPLALLAAATPVMLIAVGALAAGAASMIFNLLFETTYQRHVPPELISRLSAYDWCLSLALQPVGLALWGPVAEWLGTATALWIAAGMNVVVTGALLAVRDVRRLPAYPAVRPVPVA